ncbi:MAG: RNA polymerase sigma factor [Anaerolineae bacterium]|nr:RNA polymerase sigma factor [Anaerolineae bacterium]
MIDTNTIARAIAGNEAAQRALYEAHHAAAFRLAYLLLQDTCDAEEVVQDAFVYVFRSLHRYDPGRGSFWAWLRVALVSRCRNKRRRKQLASVSLETLAATGQVPPDPEPTNDPAGVLEMRGTQRAMWEVLQQVSAGARDALVLRYYEELPYSEIAELLGCSPDAARARVAHGKVQLKRLLTQADEGAVRETGVVHSVRVGQER